MNRIALITESSTRPDQPAPAHRFYYSPRSRWVSAVVDYMNVREFPQDRIFFLSTQHNRLIGYNEVLEAYPVQETMPGKSVFTEYAARVVAEILEKFPEKPFVEIHASRSFSDPLSEMFEKADIQFRIYSVGVPLGQKDRYYAELIEEERNIRRLKQIQREKWSLEALIEYRSVHEAKRIVEQYEPVAQLYGVEAIFNELKDLLKKFYNRDKDAKKARIEYEELIPEDAEELEMFFRGKTKLSDQFKNLDMYEELKGKYGKVFAKFTRYLIKKSYVEQMEMKISGLLLQLQIELLKRAG